VAIKDANDSQSTLPFKYGLLARFILSCLLDADRLNTADFEFPENEVLRNYGKYYPWAVLVKRLEKKFEEFARKTAEMLPGRALEVNRLRAQVAQACLDFAAKPKGIYQLTVPTGGGKTLASLRFALHHAAEHKMDRIIYVIPYISIIDQNADDVRKILEDKDGKDGYLDKVVLEHHSNLTPEEETRRHNLLAENWDAPVVFTTQVQFLEALFGFGTRNARRMHQLANAVIILDEVQTIPINIIDMLNSALRFLTHDCGSTAVLCTATQPPLDKLENPYRALIISPEQRIIQNEKELFEKLKRVEVYDERKSGGWSDDEVADLVQRALHEKGSVLVVVNTKASAQSLYQEIKCRKLAETYHLSTNMCPVHRLGVLTIVKEKLANNEPVICVSTQLIEAGVNIDFGAAIRYLAGLDSIAQSAGRCNRHGAREGLGSVWVVNPKEENIERLKDIKIGREKAQTVLDNFRDNPEAFDNDRIGLNAVAAFYNSYFSERRNEMRYPVGTNSPVGREDDLFNLLSLNTVSVQAYQRIHQSAPDIAFRQSFQTAAKSFQVIDSPTRGVVVPYKEGEELIKDLCGAFELEKQYKLLKRAQRYSVNLFSHEFDKLFEIGAIHEVQEGAGIFYLEKQYYSEDFGWGKQIVNSMEFLSG
jgi:CRISPR-associated endonuclease/helicase Cas3